MSNTIEIHCVKIEKTQSSSSTHGRTSGGGLSYKGTGGARMKGETNTTHSSQVTAGGKMYSLVQSNSCYPFSEGDDVVFLCKKNDDSGMYSILSLLNNSNGTRILKFMPTNPLIFLIPIWLIFIVSVIFFYVLVSLVIGAIVIYHIKKTHPLAKKMFEQEKDMVSVFMSLEGAKNKESLEEKLKDYDGSYLIN